MGDWWEVRTDIPTIDVDDVRFVQPVGFVWFHKPRYRIKAMGRKV